MIVKKKKRNVLYDLTGRKNKTNPSFLWADDKFITKPVAVANHVNDYIISKLGKLRENMPNLSNDTYHSLINIYIYIYAKEKSQVQTSKM